jgi:hypothetical protein
MTDVSLSAASKHNEVAWSAAGEPPPAFLSRAERATPHESQERDFRVGHVLSRSFSILRRYLLPLLLLYGVASLLLNVPVTFTTDDSPAADVFIACTVSIVLWIAFNVFAGAAAVDGAIDDMRGRRPDAAKSVRVASQRLLPVLGVTVAVVVLAILGFAVLVFPAAIVISACFVAVPVCVVEGLGPIQSMRRSVELTRGHRWRIFALWFAIMLIEAFVQSELDQAARPFGNFALILAPQVAWDALVGAFAVVLTAVTYRDLRVAKEGVDDNQVATVFD